MVARVCVQRAHAGSRTRCLGSGIEGNQGWGETRLLGRIFVAGNKSGLGAATRGTCSSSETILIVFLTLGLLTRDVCKALQIWRCPGLAVARSAFGGPQQLLFSSC